MTSEEAKKMIELMKTALVNAVDSHQFVDYDAAEAMVWAARLLDSGADCVSPDNDTMREEMEMLSEWRVGDPVLLTPRRGEDTKPRFPIGT